MSTNPSPTRPREAPVWWESPGWRIRRETEGRLPVPVGAFGRRDGIGLTVLYGIVQKHGGTITVESEEGKGAVFIIDLPILADKNEKTGR